jgi:hypothetical protein
MFIYLGYAHPDNLFFISLTVAIEQLGLWPKHCIAPEAGVPLFKTAKAQGGSASPA